MAERLSAGPPRRLPHPALREDLRVLAMFTTTLTHHGMPVPQPRVATRWDTITLETEPTRVQA